MVETEQDLTVAENTIPHVQIRLNGVLQNTAPPKEKLLIRINGSLYQKVVDAHREAKATSSQGDDVDEDDDDGEDFLDEEGNIDLGKLSKMLDDSATDAEDGPDWMFEEGETATKDPTYVFCPAAHRHQLLTKHFCQHPLLPERRGGTWTAEEIRRNAVLEMYGFCKTRGLREVWAYVWNQWYSPSMWKLWARSTSAMLSRLRTTMTVEVFWKILKHEFLHHLVHPRLDQLVWTLIYEVTPNAATRIAAVDFGHRLGRSKELTTFQKALKKEWKTLQQREVSEQDYKLDLKLLTCSCGQQKYSSHLICKHLVQALADPSAKFWTQVVRRRQLPIYRHPDLVPKGQTKDGYIDPEGGSITDGDDEVYVGNADLLKGGGGWRELVGGKKVTNTGEMATVLGKRPRPAVEERPRQVEPGRNVVREDEPELVDLTRSSSPIIIDDEEDQAEAEVSSGINSQELVLTNSSWTKQLNGSTSEPTPWNRQRRSSDSKPRPEIPFG